VRVSDIMDAIGYAERREAPVLHGMAMRDGCFLSILAGWVPIFGQIR